MAKHIKYMVWWLVGLIIFIILVNPPNFKAAVGEGCPFVPSTECTTCDEMTIWINNFKDGNLPDCELGEMLGCIVNLQVNHPSEYALYNSDTDTCDGAPTTCSFPDLVCDSQADVDIIQGQWSDGRCTLEQLYECNYDYWYTLYGDDVCRLGPSTFEFDLCTGEETCVNYQCEETCTDSDGGNNLFVKGTATNSLETRTDSCYSSTKVRECNCFGESIACVTTNCPAQCNDGACVQQTCNTDADTNCDGLVSNNELLSQLSMWVNDIVSNADLLTYITAWVNS